jgi:hypothetical protein
MKKEFNVLDMSTWGYASAFKGFVDFVKGEDVFTEMELVSLLIDAKMIIDKVHSGEAQKRYGKEDIILYLLDELADRIPMDVVLGKIIEKITYEHRLFDLLDAKSWKWARKTVPFVWWGKKIYTANRKRFITEREIVDLLGTMFEYISKDSPVNYHAKRKAIKTFLNRMLESQGEGTTSPPSID